MKTTYGSALLVMLLLSCNGGGDSATESDTNATESDTNDTGTGDLDSEPPPWVDTIESDTREVYNGWDISGFSYTSTDPDSCEEHDLVQGERLSLVCSTGKAVYTACSSVKIGTISEETQQAISDLLQAEWSDIIDDSSCHDDDLPSVLFQVIRNTGNVETTYIQGCEGEFYIEIQSLIEQAIGEVQSL